MRACVTAEGWNSASPGPAFATAFGVLPTQSSSVVVTYEHFRKVVPALLPLLDGDQTGRDYVENLAKLHTKPARVARLADDLDLEAVIAWILEPLLAVEDSWNEINGVLAPKSRTGNAVWKVLTEAKTRWDVHDRILALIAISKASADRARIFLGDVAAVASGASVPTTGWHTDKIKPDGPEVWICDLAKGVADARS
jgi:hypothetical protein